MSGKRSRDKGARGEREVRDLLRKYGYEAERGCQRAGGPDSPDVKALDFPFHIEVKRTEKINVYDAFDQAKRDAGGPGEPPPIVFHKRNRREWLVVMDAEDLMRMLKYANA